MTVSELRSWLEDFDGNADVIIDYTCSDSWYDYHGSDISIALEGKNIVLVVEN